MFSNGKKKEDKVSGFIGKNVSLSGKLDFKGMVRIDGRYEGEINAEGILSVGEDAFVKAKIRVDSITIRGKVEGSVLATERIEIQQPGKLIGDIKTPKLVIGEGAVFEGNCIMEDKTEKNKVEEIDSYKKIKKADV